MNTKEVCETLNISSKTLRIYEEKGLVQAKRGENNYRNYSDNDIVKIKHIMFLRELGFSIKDIKKLIEKSGYNNEFLRNLYIQYKAVKAKINELENIKSTLKVSINDIFSEGEEKSKFNYLKKMNEVLDENKNVHKEWIDQWNFDSWAKSYDVSVLDNTHDELKLFDGYQDIMNKLREIIKKNNAKKVLDIGCGTANLCGVLSEKLDITGMDQSVEMLILAQKKYPKIKFKFGNFLDVPFIENEFDMIVSTYAFHHLTAHEKRKALDIMLKYLKPNGKIIIADLMFLNNERKEECRRKFENENRLDLWEEIDDEYYTIIEDFKSYAEFCGCNFYYEHLKNFTWLIEIKRS